MRTYRRSHGAGLALDPVHPRLSRIAFCSGCTLKKRTAFGRIKVNSARLTCQGRSECYEAVILDRTGHCLNKEHRCMSRKSAKAMEGEEINKENERRGRRKKEWSRKEEKGREAKKEIRGNHSLPVLSKRDPQLRHANSRKTCWNPKIQRVTCCSMPVASTSPIYHATWHYWPSSNSSRKAQANFAIQRSN